MQIRRVYLVALSRKNRLTGEKDFDLVFKKGTAVKGNFLFIKYVRNSSGRCRFSVVISAKVSKRAVARNRLRRVLLTEAWGLIESRNLPIDAVVVVKKTGAEDSIKDELTRLLRGIK